MIKRKLNNAEVRALKFLSDPEASPEAIKTIGIRAIQGLVNRGLVVREWTRAKGLFVEGEDRQPRLAVTAKGRERLCRILEIERNLGGNQL